MTGIPEVWIFFASHSPLYQGIYPFWGVDWRHRLLNLGKSESQRLFRQLGHLSGNFGFVGKAGERAPLPYLFSIVVALSLRNVTTVCFPFTS